MDADWHSFRCDYQARGSIQANGCTKLKSYPNIPLLRAQAAQGWFYTEKASQEDIEFFCQVDIDRGQEADCEITKEQIDFNFKKYLKNNLMFFF